MTLTNCLRLKAHFVAKGKKAEEADIQKSIDFRDGNYENLTKEQMETKLKFLKVSFPKTSTKAELLAILKGV